VARYGIDIWMTTIAIAEGFRVCQSFLGAKSHDAKDPSSDLSAMLQQVVGSVFMLMEEYRPVWQTKSGSEPAELFGFQFDVGLDPVKVNVDRMVQTFCRGCQDLGELWTLALQPETCEGVHKLGRSVCAGSKVFHFNDDLWTRVVLDFSCAYKKHPLSRSHLLQSLMPLYLGRVASFVLENENLESAEVEQKIENLCTSFENLKSYLEAQWNDESGFDSRPLRLETRHREAFAESAAGGTAK
jgi:hypothetical protein